MKLTVVIVNYNVKYYLEQCLYSVERALQGMQGEVYVVDNASSDGSIDYLRRKFPWVYYIENTKNYGFSVANNMAIRKARGEYVLLLNPDTIVGEDTLKQCVAFMDAHSEVGGLGVRQQRVDGSMAPESRRGVPTPWTAFCKMSGLGSKFPQSTLFGRYYMQYLPIDKPSYIEVISGACMFIRAEVFGKCGLLDETFFMYGEDVDMSYRILKAGYKNVFYPATILHYKGESTQKSSYRYAIVFHKAMYIFFKKHFSYNFLLLMIVSLAIYGKAFLTYLKNQFSKKDEKEENIMEVMRQKKFMLVGKGYNLQQMKRLMVEHNLYHSVSKGLPKKLDPTADYIVFDTDAYSFAEILDWFKHDNPQQKTPHIGTYISISQTILTGNSIIQFK